jgi:hypothetical protein
MTSQIFRLEFQPWREIRLLEELSDRGIDTEKLTLLVLMETLRATGLSLVQDPLRSSPFLCVPPPGPSRWFPMFSDDDEDEDEDEDDS